jgi:serine/threonine protein kinase
MDDEKRLCREALVWRQLHHPHVLPFLGLDYTLFPQHRFPCMISPWMENGMLKDYVKTSRYNPKQDTLPIVSHHRVPPSINALKNQLA